MKRLAALLAAALLGSSLFAQVQLPPLFSDNMVLPRSAEVPVWGKAHPGAVVTVTPSWEGAVPAVCAADSDGKWKVTLSTPATPGPYYIRISSGKRKNEQRILQNVLCGDVWLCSGQSNMEMPLNGWARVYDYEKEIAGANNYPTIRLLNVTRSYSTAPKDTFEAQEGGWMVCSAESVPLFSACGYFFGRNLYEATNVPIGLINASYGGTNIEGWISMDALRTLKSAETAIEQGKNAVSADSLNVVKEQWLRDILSADRGLEGKKALWTGVNFDDSSWKTLRVPGNISPYGLGDWDGVLWMRREIWIPQSWAGKDIKLELSTIDDDDDTYFNGVLVGSTEGYTFPRHYTVPGKLVKAGKAVITVRLIDRRWNAGIMGEEHQVYAECNGGKIPLTGEWKYRIGSSSEDSDVPAVTTFRSDFPSILYNAMIAPLIPYPIKGAIWYQGENNAPAGQMYRETMPLMIRDWRERWGYDFPFFQVQLTSYHKGQAIPGEYSEWADLRESQALTAKNVCNSSMAVTIDVGDAEDIHPRNKQEVGRRLSLLARKYAYGEKDLVAESPSLDCITICGNEIRVRFRNCGDGLKTSDGQAVRGFEIAGGDHQFHFASARIEGNEVVVSQTGVVYPQAVRYAWSDNPAGCPAKPSSAVYRNTGCNLVGSTGLPVGTFRTDDWPSSTSGRVTKY